ncbi:hypothetical protein C8Q80DRAFT_1264132 [Daedaleopsis nitida]|nr:hypothetical protein C8Q80DRAFT_1264132 [Daedaleopsis nitida]
MKQPTASSFLLLIVGIPMYTFLKSISRSSPEGRSQGIVTATGVKTEIGAIAASLQGSGGTKVRKVRRDEEGKKLSQCYISAYALTVTDTLGRFLGVDVGTPLQRRLSQLAVSLFVVAVVFAVIVAAANNFVSNRVVIIYAVSTGLCMILASLIVVLTIIFAVSTLTQGRMVARRIWLPSLGNWTLEGSGDPFDPPAGRMVFHRGGIEAAPPGGGGGEAPKPDAPERCAFLECASLCNIASVFQEPAPSADEKSGDKVWAARGEPTEIALQVLAHKLDPGRPGTSPESAKLPGPRGTD